MELAAGFIVRQATSVELLGELIVRHSGPVPWLAGWNYRKPHTLTGSTAGALTNYQVGVKVYYGAGADGTEVIGGVTFGKVYCDSKCKTDFSDIRFTNRDGTTLLDYWLQEKIDSDYAIFWVEVDSVPASPSTVDIYIYYGNASATYVDAQQHGKDTFIAFDAFPGVALDGQWTVDANITVTVAGGILTCKATAGSWSTWHGIHMAVANVQGIRLESYGVSWAHVANDLFQFGSLLGVDWTHQSLGSRLSDTHQSTAESFLTYVYDNNGLAKGNIQGQEPVDLIEQRDQNGVAKFFKDGVEQQAGGETSNDSFDTLMILVNRLTTYQCPNLYLDRILARSYVDPEPAHTAWGPEAEETLFAQFSVRHSTSQELLGELIVRHPALQELLGKFVVSLPGSAELLAEFLVRHPASVELLGEFFLGVDASEELGGIFDVHYRRIYGENWQRKSWFVDPYYWRSYYDLALDSFVFEYIHKTGLTGNVWTENVNARIDCSGFAAAAIDADFSVRGPRSGLPVTTIYSDGHDAWIAESDEASVLGWAWQNTTKVFDATAPDWYRRVGVFADRRTPTSKLYIVAVYYDDAPGGVQYVRLREQTTPLDITAWEAIEDVSNTANTDNILGVMGRSMGSTGVTKKEIIVAYKEGIAIRSRYHTDVGWQAIQDVDTTAELEKSLACFDAEHYEITGANCLQMIYVDADNTVRSASRPAGIASVWADFVTIDDSTTEHDNVGIVTIDSIQFLMWQDGPHIGYRMHRCNPDTWWPALVNPYNEFDPTTESVVATTSQPEQIQGPDDIAAGDAVAINWVGLIAGAAGRGWGILQAATSEALPAKFSVRRSASADLAASFDGQATQSLPGEFVVRQAASQDLAAKFHPGQDKENLPAELIVRHPASEDLAAAFDAQVSLNLPAEFSVRRSVQLELPAEFVVNQGSEDLPAEFVVRGAGAEDLPAEMNVIQWLDLSAGFDVRTADSENLLGEFIVRHADSQELVAHLEISYDASEELLAKFQARVTSDANEIVIAVNPSAWINYGQGVGTGFLDGPYLGPDNVQKVYGESSLAFLSDYLKNRFDYLKFGWKKDAAFTTNMWRTDFCVEDITFVDRITESWDWDEQTIISDIIEDTYTRLSWWVPGGNAGWSYGNTNYGAQDNLRCSRFYGTPPGSFDQQRDDEEIFIKFSLSGLGVASLERLAYARIELYRYMGDENAKSRLNARRIAECFETPDTYTFWNPANRIGSCVNPTPYPWDETSIRWATTGRNQFTMGGGAPYMGLPAFTNSSPTSRYGLTTDINTWDMIRITDLLEGWLDGSHKNEGIGILAESIDGADSAREMNTFFTTPRFYSSRAAHVNKPRLRLQYIPEDSVGRWSFENPDRWEINITDPHLGTGALHLIDWSKVSYDESRTNQSSVTLVTDYTFEEGAITTRFRLNSATYPRLHYASSPNKYVEYTTPRTNFFNIYLRYQDSSNYYLIQLRAAGESSTIIRRLSAANTTLSTFDSGIPAGTDWSKLRIFWAVDNSGTLNICCFVWNTLHAVWDHLASGADANNYWDTGGDITFESYDAELDETVISERVI